MLPTPAESPRAAWRPFLSPTGALIGGPHSFLYILGGTLVPSHVTLELPASWTVATGLEPTADPRTFFAPTVDALVDGPIFAGRFHDWRFAVDGVPHRLVYWATPAAAPFDTLGFARGVEGIVRQAVALFGRPPYRDYTFVLQDSAYGALEHRNSVTLGAPSASLGPHPEWTYGELAHEYTHTWNLMRIRPEEYGDVDYHTQKPVAGLWFSEGLTMRYADRFLRQARLPVQDSTLLAHLEGLIGRYLAGPGNARFSAEQISRVAYNAEPGALGDYSASVHLVGELLGNVMDLVIRDATANRRSMDDVMRLMLERHSGERGFSGRDVERVATEVCGCATMHALFDAHVRGADADRLRSLAGAGGAAHGRHACPSARSRREAAGGPSRARMATAVGRAAAHDHHRSLEHVGTRGTAQPRSADIDQRSRDDELARSARPVRQRAHRRYAAVRDRATRRTVPDERRDERVRATGSAHRGDHECDARQRAVRAGWLARALAP